MAEGFEPYHVPQQSRRDKLRFGNTAAHHNDHNLQALLYDPSLIPSHFMIHGCPVKDEAINLMGSVSSSAAHYLDPHADSHPLVNPSSIHDINSGGNEPFLYNPRDFDQSSYNAHEVFVFKPEPLSLSLSSHNTRHHHPGHPLELNLQRYGGGYVVPGIVGGGGSGSASDDVSRSSAPLGPFTGYASILKGSRFLKPAQQLLEEFCDVGHVICAEKFAADSSLMEQNPPLESLTGGGGDDPRSSGDGGSANQRKKSTLISMLDEVYRRYKQYYQQMQAVAASFECVSGLGNAAPYANQALKTMSKHFKCLKDAISDQLQFTNKAHGKDEAARFGNTDKGFYSQRAVNNSAGYVESQPVWRPQRGLPERAVTVLRAWLFEHFLHPYPTDTDKQMLAKQTGLSRSQVSNWFINARVRLWKPMVEEIHMLETRQAHKGFQREGGGGGNNNGPIDHLKPVNTDPPENPSSSQRLQGGGGPVRMEEPLNLPYNGMTGHGSSSVSLTLGLHQNNCIGLSEPFPIHAAQRFGLSLEGNSEGYVMGGFEAQHGHFGREGVGGQLLHDFVG